MRERRDNTCGYWECNRPIPYNHFLCAEHYDDWQNYLIDECPKCGRFKDAMYDLCLDCNNRRPFTPWKPPVAITKPKRYQELEHSEAWAKGDKNAERFYVYILKLSDGTFYVGQTREIRERLSEHRDQKALSTAGRNPKLEYFEILPSREAAEMREAKLKEINNTNPRQIRRMIIGFQDIIREIQLK